jgi:hypothetical protein
VGGGPFGGCHAEERSGGWAQPNQQAADNGLAVARAGGAHVGGTQTGEDGALTRGPGLCAGF